MTKPLMIGGREFVPDFRFFDKQPLQSNITLQDQGAEPSEVSLSRYGWKRSQTDWRFGGGQQWLDQEDEANRRRYYEATGAGFDTDGILDAVPPAAVHQSANGSALNKLIAGDPANGVTVLLRDAGASKLTGGLGATNAGTLACTPTDAVVLDGEVIIAQGTGTTMRTESLSTWTALSNFGTVTPDRFVIASSRLLGLEGNALYEIDAAGAQLTAIMTHPSSTFAWKGGVAAPNGVYLWGDDGITSDVYLLVPVDSTGEFANPFPACPWPVGETIHAMEEFGGVVVFATSRGIRVANINGSGFLTYGDPMDELGPITSLASDAKYIYGGFTSTFFRDSTAVAGIARFKMRRFTDTLVPAYDVWLDVEKANAGITTVDSVALNYSSGTVWPLCSVTDSGGDTLVGGGALNDSDDVRIRFGKITYGSPEEFLFLSFEAEFANNQTINGNATLKLYVDDELHTLVATIDDDAKMFRFTADEAIRGRTFDLELTFAMSAGASSTYELERSTLRCLPMPEQVQVIEMGVLLGGELTGDRRRRGLPDSFESWEFLDNLDQTKQLIEMKVGTKTWVGFVDAFSPATEMIKDDLDTSSSGTFLQGTWIVRLVVSPDAAV